MAVSHPSRKNKYAARMGHPTFVGRLGGELGYSECRCTERNKNDGGNGGTLESFDDGGAGAFGEQRKSDG